MSRGNRGPSAIVMAMLAGASLLVFVGVSVAVSGRPSVELVAPPSLQDDPDPPAPPPEKADAAWQGENHGPLATEPESDAHAHDETPPSGIATGNAQGITAPLGVNDPDIWVCVTEDGKGYARIIHEPTTEMKEAARQWLIEKRSQDPSFMPVVEFPGAPEGCEPVPGEPSLEDWLAERSILTVMNPDGSIKPSEKP